MDKKIYIILAVEIIIITLIIGGSVYYFKHRDDPAIWHKCSDLGPGHGC